MLFMFIELILLAILFVISPAAFFGVIGACALIGAYKGFTR